MKSLLYIFTLLLSVPLMAQDDTPIEVPQIAVKVGIAQTIDFDGVSITFLKVLTDSRCPKNVECMWAGEAKALVRIETEDGRSTEETITFKNGISVVAELYNKELQFLRLTPYPDANISKEDRAPYALLTRAVAQ